MKKLWLAVIAAFGLMGSVHADDVDQEQAVKQQHHHNFLSKRPYAKVPVAKQDTDGKWIGAGIVLTSLRRALTSTSKCNCILSAGVLTLRPWLTKAALNKIGWEQVSDGRIPSVAHW